MCVCVCVWAGTRSMCSATSVSRSPARTIAPVPHPLLLPAKAHGGDRIHPTAVHFASAAVCERRYASSASTIRHMYITSSATTTVSAV